LSAWTASSSSSGASPQTVDGDHHRMAGRVHVETDDITKLGGEVGIAGSLEGPDPVRLELIPTAFRADSFGDSLKRDFLTPLAREIRAMPAAVRLREDYTAEELRGLARRSKDANQSRRLLSLAGV
jgi:hypothetical protein